MNTSLAVILNEVKDPCISRGTGSSAIADLVPAASPVQGFFAALRMTAKGGALLGLTACALLAGCRVGPKYVAPAPPPPAPLYKESAPAQYANTDDKIWHPANPQDAMLKGKWWEIFHEPALNSLEDELDINNQNIAVYFNNFLAARAQINQARASLYPTVTVGTTYQRTRSPGTLRGTSLGSSSTGTTTTGTGTGTGTTTVASNGSTSTALGLPFDVSWEPDLWGRVRNQISEYRFASQVSAADLENERLTEQADLAEYFFELRGQDALQDVYNRTIKADEDSLKLTQALYETGIDSEESVVQARVTLQNAQEAGVGVAQNRAIYEHAIATLIGKPASSFSFPVEVKVVTAPPIPVGLPSQLLQRRPDVAAAERTMAEANALIGYEQAAYYPTLPLTGSGGLESSHISDLFSLPALFWSLGGQASETILDGGLRKATIAQYRAQYDADVATYRETVLTAFQQVEDYLATLRVTSTQIEREDAAIKSAQRYLELATDRWRLGLDPYLDVITAQTTLLNNEQTQVTLKTSEMTAAVELIQALGGGWDVTQLPSAAAVNTPAGVQAVKSTP